MTDGEYLALAEAVLDRIERCVDTADVDIECDRSGNVLTLEFDDGGKIIVNLQPPMHEVWIAAKAGGFHFRHVDGAWRDTRGGDELFAALQRRIAEQGGETVDFAQP